MSNKLNKIYLDIFKKISKEERHNIYRKTKQEIKNICNKNERYESVEYIEIEIERVEDSIENKKSPYLSILYALILVAIPILVSIIKDVIGKTLGIDFTNMSDSVRFTLFIYIIIASLLVYMDINNRENQFMCYYIYRTVLKELKMELIASRRSSITEVAVTSEHRIIKEINEDIKSIKEFMGMN